MPAVYDAGRQYAPEVLDLWLRAIARVAGPISVQAILDLGCGTGRYSGPLAEFFGASVIAVDPSEEMLVEARQKAAANVIYVHGMGESLPVPDVSVDLIFMSMVFHHFADPAQVVRECRRVLRPGGVVVLRGGSVERIEDYPAIQYFPECRPLLRGTLLSVDAVTRTFTDAGFAAQAHEIVMSEVAASWPAYAEKLALRANSFLLRLSDEAFASGLRKLQAHARAHPQPQPVVEPIDLLAFRAA
jgi:ubiquinone/menaquinone biosynthesis C-methylase UbiE